MSMWELLGIEETTDVAAIKRAYAARAKQCHPEEHPEEFRRLQRAYRDAAAWAKQREPREEAKEAQASDRSREDVPETAEGAGAACEGNAEGIRAGKTDGAGAAPREGSKEAGASDRSREDGPGFMAVTDAVRGELLRHKRERLAGEAWLAAKNPYLQNSPAYWRYLFSQEEYREILDDPVFTGKLARILGGTGGWYRRTVRMIDGRLAPADPGIRWKWLTYRPNDRPFPTDKTRSAKLTEIHGMLLNSVAERGYSGDIEHDREALGVYLELYLPFAEQNALLLERLGRNVRRAAFLAHALAAAALLGIGVALYLQLAGVSGGSAKAGGPEQGAGEAPEEFPAGSEWNRQRLDELLEEISGSTET